MSKLNYNNIDVQRYLNVLNELFKKLQVCSFISFGNLQKNIDLIQVKFTFPELLKDINDHYKKVRAFFETHIVIQEEPKEEEKNIQEEEKEQADEEGQQKEKEIEKKERIDLVGIEEGTSPESIALAKSTRNFCRKYYRDPVFLKAIEEFKTDPKVNDFMQKFEEKFVSHFQKKSMMTLEEEESEIKLNVLLTQKINDLNDQIRIKSDRYAKLKEEREKFKKDCQKKINDIYNEIQKLKMNTANDLNTLGKKVNQELNNEKDLNDQRLKDLRAKYNNVIEEFNDKKKKDEEEEKKYLAEYNKRENDLRGTIGEYDTQMKNDKEHFEEKKKDESKLKNNLTSVRIELNKLENKYNVYKDNFLLTQEKDKQVQYEYLVKERAVEWIQGQFRGFFTRKQMRKKFPFLKVLRAPKIIEPVIEKKGAKGKKK